MKVQNKQIERVIDVKLREKIELGLVVLLLVGLLAVLVGSAAVLEGKVRL